MFSADIAHAINSVLRRRPEGLWHTMTDKYNVFSHRLSTVCHRVADRFSCDSQYVDIMAAVLEPINVTVKFQPCINMSARLFSLVVRKYKRENERVSADRNWQADPTLQASQVNAPECCRCCRCIRAESEVFSKPLRTNSKRFKLNKAWAFTTAICQLQEGLCAFSITRMRVNQTRRHTIPGMELNDIKKVDRCFYDPKLNLQNCQGSCFCLWL